MEENMRRIKYMILSCVIILTSSVPATASVGSSYKKYRNDKNISKYRYVDIDQNGVKEMVFATEADDSAICGVCTYKNKKVVCLASIKLGKYYPYVYYSKNRKKFALITSNSASAMCKIYKLTNGKAKLVKTMNYQRQPSRDYKFYINGIESTEEKYHEAENVLDNWKKIDLRK